MVKNHSCQNSENIMGIEPRMVTCKASTQPSIIMLQYHKRLILENWFQKVQKCMQAFFFYPHYFFYFISQISFTHFYYFSMRSYPVVQGEVRILLNNTVKDMLYTEDWPGALCTLITCLLWDIFRISQIGERSGQGNSRKILLSLCAPLSNLWVYLLLKSKILVFFEQWKYLD